MQREIDFREREIGKLKSDIGKRETELSSAEVSSKINGQQKTQLEDKVLQKEIQIKKL